MFTASAPHRAATRNCLFAENIRDGKFYDALLSDERADLLMFINFPEKRDRRKFSYTCELRSDLEVALAVSVPDKTGRR